MHLNPLICKEEKCLSKLTSLSEPDKANYRYINVFHICFVIGVSPFNLSLTLNPFAVPTSGTNDSASFIGYS